MRPAIHVPPFAGMSGYRTHPTARARHEIKGSVTVIVEQFEDGGGDIDDVFPVAPFDKDLRAAVKRAFDRSKSVHTPVSVDSLQTYAEALAGYPNRAENKFLNGRPYDTGRTERRHIIATSINLIGKEADRMDEEYVLGLRGEMAIDYGGDPGQGARAAAYLRRAVAVHGKSVVSAATGVSRGTLAKIERGERAKTNVDPDRILRALKQISVLGGAMQRSKEIETVRLKQIVATAGGIRPASRVMGIDPSNLAKRLRRGRNKAQLTKPKLR